MNIGKVTLVMAVLFTLIACGGGSGDKDKVDDSLNPVQLKSETMIINVSTVVGGNRMENILSPAQEAVIETTGLNSTEVQIVLTQPEQQYTVEPSLISIEDQTLSFKAPGNIKDGKISIVHGDATTAKLSYSVFTEDTPIILSIEPPVARPGDRVTVMGVNLPEIPLMVSFDGKSSEFNLTVTPFENRFSFDVPAKLSSGDLFLQVGQLSSNKLNLAVKKDIKAQVSLADGLVINASDISFVLGGVEYGLDNDFTADIPVNNAELQYIHAVVDLHDGTYPVIYSAVVLPEASGTVTVNAESTAITWVFMGIGGELSADEEKMQLLYEAVAANPKVQDFAD